MIIAAARANAANDADASIGKEPGKEAVHSAAKVSNPNTNVPTDTTQKVQSGIRSGESSEWLKFVRDAIEDAIEKESVDQRYLLAGQVHNIWSMAHFLSGYYHHQNIQGIEDLVSPRMAEALLRRSGEEHIDDPLVASAGEYPSVIGRERSEVHPKKTRLILEAGTGKSHYATIRIRENAKLGRTSVVSDEDLGSYWPSRLVMRRLKKELIN